MFTITNTRIVGLIAVVCAAVVAPQALATSSTHSRIAPPEVEPRRSSRTACCRPGV